MSQASNGIEALEKARELRPDLIVLDLMLPELGGLEVCRILRQESTTPVLVLSARDSELDKIVGLRVGADDYMTKPFLLAELTARVMALLRRAQPAIEERGVVEVEEFGEFRLDRGARSVRVGPGDLRLSPKEFDLLSFLLANPRRVHSREQLIQHVRGPKFFGERKTVDVHVRWLREKFEPFEALPFRITTVYGVGYRLDRVLEPARARPRPTSGAREPLTARELALPILAAPNRVRTRERVTLESPLAVIDIGSNSARIAVLRLDASGQLDIIADARTSLQLARHIDAARPARGERDHRGGCRGARLPSGGCRGRRRSHRRGGDRGDPHRDQPRQRARQAGGRHRAGDQGHRWRGGGAIRVSGGRPRPADRQRLPGGCRWRELRARLLRAPADPTLVDLRARLAGRDRPVPRQRPAATLGDGGAARPRKSRPWSDAGVPVLPEGGGMVGTGGTVRNLAKIHMRSVAHPIARVDGYVLQRREVRELTTRLTPEPLVAAHRAGTLHRPGGFDRRRRAGCHRRHGRTGCPQPHGLRAWAARRHRTGGVELPLPEVWQVRRASVTALCIAVLDLGRAQGSPARRDDPEPSSASPIRPCPPRCARCSITPPRCSTSARASTTTTAGATPRG